MGRRRKPGPREPNGQLKRTYADPRRQVWEQPHRREFDEANDPLCSTALGRFVLRHRLRRELYYAGVAYLRAFTLYRISIGAPAPTPKSGSLQVRIGGHLVELSDISAKKALSEYMAADRCLGKCRATILALTIEDRDITDGGMAIMGLAALAGHYGLMQESAHPFL